MVHGLGNTVSGVYPEIAHGQALACLTPPIMRFNITKGGKKTVKRYCDIARTLGEDLDGDDKENAMKSVEAVSKLIKRIGLKEGLSECGASEKDITKMIDISFTYGTGAIACNPVKATKADAARIYKESF